MDGIFSVLLVSFVILCILFPAFKALVDQTPKRDPWEAENRNPAVPMKVIVLTNWTASLNLP